METDLVGIQNISCIIFVSCLMHEHVHTIVACPVFLESYSSQAVQVSTTSSSVPHKGAALENTSNSTVEEAVLDDQSDRGMTLGHALSLNQVKETSLASVEELQNLAGGADIKVILFTIHMPCTLSSQVIWLQCFRCVGQV